MSLRDEEHAALATLAERHDVSLSWLTRQAVAEFLARQKVDNPRPGLDLPLRAAADE
ncbi:MAG: ribbon-helix-helix domain-containing protein [Albidovulum sp.]|nr:ribbon-helix-helix domain-containing protein [Albidovulum sp.]